MRKLLLGLSAIALISIATFVVAQSDKQQSATEPTPTASQLDTGTRMRLAAMDTSPAAFRKLDGDHDGRISAIEAADNPRVAAAFTLADKDKDGYLSQEEFESLSSSATRLRDVDASSPNGDRVSEPTGEQRASKPPR
jgi:hypothetical protein